MLLRLNKQLIVNHHITSPCNTCIIIPSWGSFSSLSLVFCCWRYVCAQGRGYCSGILLPSCFPTCIGQLQISPSETQLFMLRSYAQITSSLILLTFKSRNPAVKGYGAGWRWIYPSTLPLFYNVFHLLFSYHHLPS